MHVIAVQYELFQNGVNCKPIPCSKVCPLCPAVHDAKPMAFRIVNHIIFYTWVWVNTYRYIFSGMNIHLPAILGFTRYQGFDPSPHVSSFFSCSKHGFFKVSKHAGSGHICHDSTGQNIGVFGIPPGIISDQRWMVSHLTDVWIPMFDGWIPHF